MTTLSEVLGKAKEMTMYTGAAIVRSPGDAFRFEDVEMDGPGPGEVLVRMIACGVCHTDCRS